MCIRDRHNETRDALSRFWLRARRKSCGLVILSKGTFDNAMGQNSCQPEGLQPELALAALLVLAIERLLPSPGALPSPILAATHTCFIMLWALRERNIPPSRCLRPARRKAGWRAAALRSR